MEKRLKNAKPEAATHLIEFKSFFLVDPRRRIVKNNLQLVRQ